MQPAPRIRVADSISQRETTRAGTADITNYVAALNRILGGQDVTQVLVGTAALSAHRQVGLCVLTCPSGELAARL